MISGYSLYDHLESDSYKRKLTTRLRKNAVLLGSAVLFYFVTDLFKDLLRGKSTILRLRSMVGWKEIVKLILFNNFPGGIGGGVLWFLFALLYIYAFNILICQFFKKKDIGKICFWSFSTLLIANILIIIFTAIGDDFCHGLFSSHLLYSNWLVSGLPCFYIGMGCRAFTVQNQEKLKTKVHQMVVTLIVLVVINYLFCKLLDVTMNLYLSYTPFSILMDLIIFAFSSVVFISDNNILVIAGEKYSRDVYLLHPFIHSVTNMFFGGRLEGIVMTAYVQPVLVVALSFGMSAAMEYLISSIRTKRIV